jgi:hypothetical protein
MENRPSSEADRFSDSQEYPRILGNPKVYYCINKCKSALPILSPFDLVQIATPDFLKIHRNIILSSTPVSPKWSLSLRFHNQTFYTPLLHPIFIRE